MLVVDDNDSAREILRNMSAAFGLQVDVTDNGGSAVALTVLAQEKKQPYDMILLDWMMPEIDGIATLKRMQAQAGLALPKVVMVTAYGRSEALQAAHHSGVGIHGVLTKPVTASTLYETFSKVIGSAPLVKQTRQVVQRESIRASASKLRGLKLLLVEDNEINQELAIDLLQNAGVEVVLANNGQEAIDILAQQTVDAVLMDCQMPVMDGYTATAILRRDPRFATLPIIAMTANAMSQDRERVLAVGMNDHITKPLDVAMMFTTIAKWVSPRTDLALAPALPLPEPMVVPSALEARRARAPDGGSPLPGGMPELPGVQVRAGLRVMSGSVPFYQRMLRKFADSERDFGLGIGAALAQSDLPLATRMAHTLKGLAGNLGARELQQAADRLETACMAEPRDAGAIAALLAPVIAELARVVEGIDRLLPMPDDVGVPGVPSADAPVPEPVADVAPALRLALLANLDALAVLIDNSDADAIEKADECLALLKGNALRPMAHAATLALQSYDFEKAADTLASLRQALG